MKRGVRGFYSLYKNLSHLFSLIIHLSLMCSAPYFNPFCHSSGSGGPGPCWGVWAVRHMCRVLELRRPPLRLVCPVQHVSFASYIFLPRSHTLSTPEGLKPRHYCSPKRSWKALNKVTHVAMWLVHFNIAHLLCSLEFTIINSWWEKPGSGSGTVWSLLNSPI